MKRLLFILFLYSGLIYGQTNSLVTEYYLSTHFTPKSGITPGTNNTLAMDCDQILARYNVLISGVTTTGKRCPSQNQLTSGIFPDPGNTQPTFVNQLTFTTGINFHSIEFSSNGLYMFLIRTDNRTHYIRRYTLASPFNIATVLLYSSYQEVVAAYDDSNVIWTNFYLDDLHISQDGTRISYTKYQNAIISVLLGTAYDLTTTISTTITPINESYESLLRDGNLNTYTIDPTGSIITTYINGYSGEDAIPFEEGRILYLLTPWDFSTVSYEQNVINYYTTNALTFEVPTNNLSPEGLEYNSDGTKLYTISSYNSANFKTYTYTGTPYTASGTLTTVSSYDLGFTTYFNYAPPIDFCFSDDYKYMYVLTHHDTQYMNTSKVYQFQLY